MEADSGEGGSESRPGGGMARARSKAWIAATQQIPSAEHLHRMRTVAPPMVTGFVGCSPEAVFPGAGGMPIERDGWVVAALGVGGPAPDICAEIAAAIVGSV
jgi:uncharacterized protein GlcG (DUF336 family)